MQITRFKRDGEGAAEKTGIRAPLGKIGLVGAVAAASIMISSPLVEKKAHAQEDTQAPAPAADSATATPAESAGSIEVGELQMRFPAETQTTPISAPKPNYHDEALGSSERVDVNGNERPINLDHKWSGGGGIVSNEAGSAVSGSMAYNLTPNSQFKFDAGNVWFGSLSVPFTTLSVKEKLELGRFIGLYYGRLTGAAYLPSHLYTSQSIGIGYSQPFGSNDNLRFRIGVVGVGAFSYPLGDDTYLNIAGGASLEYRKRILIYGDPNFYFAANTPIQTAYIGNYSPKFESLRSGIQIRFSDYSIGPFANYGVVKSIYGFGASRAINFDGLVAGDVFIKGGITHWNPQINDSNDVFAMAGLRLVIAGKHMNTIITSTYEHTSAGGVPQATIDIPTTQTPGPYGFGRSGDAYWDNVDNTAKGNLVGAKSSMHSQPRTRGLPRTIS